jgi:hypothetical protein
MKPGCDKAGLDKGRHSTRKLIINGSENGRENGLPRLRHFTAASLISPFAFKVCRHLLVSPSRSRAWFGFGLVEPATKTDPLTGAPNSGH